MKVLISILVTSFLSLTAMAEVPQIETTQSLYLGEVRTVSLTLPAQLLTQKIEWSIDNSHLLKLNSGELIQIYPELDTDLKTLKLRLAIPYISPSFENAKVSLTAKDELQNSLLEIKLDLTVRAELVIRFRKMSESFSQNNLLSRQSKSAFEWDLPLDPTTGDYLPLSVNNHPRGLWVRFRYDDRSGEKLLRTGGYLIHIYRGEGQYIVHQPFDRDTHLETFDCPFDPISKEEWRNPDLGLKAKGQPWANCEFRGYIPKDAAYGFEFREHYVEGESHKKVVRIENIDSVNEELVRIYKLYEELGIGLGAFCSQWD